MFTLIASFSLVFAYLTAAQLLARAFRHRRLSLAARGEAILADNRFCEDDKGAVKLLLDRMFSYRMTWALTFSAVGSVYRAFKSRGQSRSRLSEPQLMMANFCFDSTRAMMATNSLLAFVVFNTFFKTAQLAARTLHRTGLKESLNFELARSARAH